MALASSSTTASQNVAAPAFLMVQPHPFFGRDHAGNNYREVATQNEPRNPRVAFEEWIALADAIVAAGGTVYVMSPSFANSKFYPTAGSTDMVYAANTGFLGGSAELPMFLGANMLYPSRQQELGQVQRFWTKILEVPVFQARHIFEGQADLSQVFTVDGIGRRIFTNGIRSQSVALEQIEHFLRDGNKTLSMQVRDETYFHGDTCLSVLQIPNAEKGLVLHAETAFTAPDLAEIGDFLKKPNSVKSNTTFISLSQSDAEDYFAANSLQVGATLMMIEGASAELVDELTTHGLAIHYLKMDELFGKGGGGPRCCVIKLPAWLSDAPELTRRLNAFRYERPIFASQLDDYETSVRPGSSD